MEDTSAVLLTRLEGIEAALRALPDAIAAATRIERPSAALSQPNRRILRSLLPAINAALGDLVWSVGDLVEHANGDPVLDAALRRAFGHPFRAKSAGWALRSGEGLLVDGVVLERIAHASARGNLWRVRRL